jgi:hypothetical protein
MQISRKSAQRTPFVGIENQSRKANRVLRRRCSTAPVSALGSALVAICVRVRVVEDTNESFSGSSGLGRWFRIGVGGWLLAGGLIHEEDGMTQQNFYGLTAAPRLRTG